MLRFEIFLVPAPHVRKAAAATTSGAQPLLASWLWRRLSGNTAVANLRGRRWQFRVASAGKQRMKGVTNHVCPGWVIRQRVAGPSGRMGLSWAQDLESDSIPHQLYSVHTFVDCDTV